MPKQPIKFQFRLANVGTEFANNSYTKMYNTNAAKLCAEALDLVSQNCTPTPDLRIKCGIVAAMLYLREVMQNTDDLPKLFKNLDDMIKTFEIKQP